MQHTYIPIACIFRQGSEPGNLILAWGCKHRINAQKR